MVIFIRSKQGLLVVQALFTLLSVYLHYFILSSLHFSEQYTVIVLILHSRKMTGRVSNLPKIIRCIVSVWTEIVTLETDLGNFFLLSSLRGEHFSGGKNDAIPLSSKAKKGSKPIHFLDNCDVSSLSSKVKTSTSWDKKSFRTHSILLFTFNLTFTWYSIIL